MKRIILKFLFISLVFSLLSIGQFGCSNGKDGEINLDGRIVFESIRGLHQDIYLINLRSNMVINLTRTPELDWKPRFSLSGNKIIFTSNGQGKNIICILDLMTQEILSLDNQVNVSEPCLSPDEKKVVFVRYGEIYIMNIDGTEAKRLTYEPNFLDWNPCFTTDGNKIVFTSNRDGDHEIYIMNVDGSEQTRLTNNMSDDLYPCISPDGDKVVFTSNRDGNYEIYIMNIDGSNQIRLTNNSYWDGQPCFSPDGKKIAFTSTRDGNHEIYVMNIDGSNQTRITKNPNIDIFPSWGL